MCSLNFHFKKKYPGARLWPFGPIEKIKMTARSLIGRQILEYSSGTAEWSLMKLDRKQNLNVLYEVYVLGPRLEKKITALARDLYYVPLYRSLALADPSRKVTHCTQVHHIKKHFGSLVFLSDRKHKLGKDVDILLSVKFR